MNKYRLPTYVHSNAGYYNKLAEQFHTEIAKATTEVEYNSILLTLLKRWKREFTDIYVLQYLAESGEFEPDTVELINQWYVDNAEPFQRAFLTADIKPNIKYTLVYLNEFGFPVADHVLFLDIKPIQYAQFTDAISVRMKRKKKRTEFLHYFYNCELAIFEGWQELPREVTHEEIGGEMMVKSKYHAFDKQYFIDCVEYLGDPILSYMILKS